MRRTKMAGRGRSGSRRAGRVYGGSCGLSAMGGRRGCFFAETERDRILRKQDGAESGRVRMLREQDGAESGRGRILRSRALWTVESGCCRTPQSRRRGVWPRCCRRGEAEEWVWSRERDR
ncbi:MAG: hypothetical protein Q4C60_09195 [Eubacteriales bacterium]|nr:hypothetical protein [Eubacteriales bacterium]